jgi:hypothetical protein
MTDIVLRVRCTTAQPYQFVAALAASAIGKMLEGITDDVRVTLVDAPGEGANN